MNRRSYLLALDQGTSSSRAIVFDTAGNICALAQKEFRQYYPQPGWVEHDPEEIWQTQAEVAGEAVAKIGGAEKIAAIGITNQRETTVVWDRRSGRPICNAIVWQDRRTADFCESLKKNGQAEVIREKTGLIVDAYFSATKLKWILEHIPNAGKLAANGQLAFGTIDSWLIWNLTGGKHHITDISNASRTMLFNIHTRQWDNDLLEIFDIPASILPQVVPSGALHGYSQSTTAFPFELPIAGIAGDQQAALFGQMCIEKGMLKNTYGTGCFMMLNTGHTPVVSQNRLLTTIAWEIDSQVTYALEGSVFVAGAVVQWLRDGLKIIRDASEIEALAATVPDNGGVYFVPAFTGLGAPHWDAFARGAMLGLTRGSTAGHIARAALESIAFQTMDMLRAMEADAGIKVPALRVDGGATANNLLMQFQADLLNITVERPTVLETTALGAAYLAGLGIGLWQTPADIASQWQAAHRFTPNHQPAQINPLIRGWHKALHRAKNWDID
jgi:glycerol kinase